MLKYKKIIIQFSVLALFILAFVMGYGLAMFKLSVTAKRQPPAPIASACECNVKPNLSFKEILNQKSVGSAERLPAVKPPSSNSNSNPRLLEQNVDINEGNIQSIAGLKQFLNNLTVDNFDMELIRDYLDSSSEAFQFIVSQFDKVTDPEKRSLLLDVISESDNSDKLVFAQELISSNDVAVRKRAYSWLADSEQNGTAQNALINASYYESSPEALTDIVSALSVVDLESDAHATAVVRLSELSFHENAEVAAHAIGVVSGISQDTSTLNMLNSHVNGSNETLKIAALNGLYYFNGDNEEIYASVSRILDDPSSSRDTKDIAGELLSVWNQNRSQDEGELAEAEESYYRHE